MGVGCVVAKADPHRPRFQRPRAFVGKGGAVQTRTDRNALLRQKRRRFLTVHPRPEGHRRCLMRPGEYLHPQFLQALGTPFQLPVLPAENVLHTCTADKPQSLRQSRVTGYVQRPRFQAVRQVIRHGLIDGVAARPPEQQRLGIAAMLRREFWESREYLRQKQEAAEKGEYFAPDFEKECYLPVLRGDIPLKAHVHRVDDIFTAIRIAKEFGIKMTMDHCSEGHLVAEELAKEGFPAIVGPDLTSRNKIEVQNMSFKTAGVLNRAGVMVAITTDHPVSQIQTLPLCAGLAVKAGLPMEEGFRAITIYPAKICGVADRIGSLEVGKDADIAIFDGNPMEIFTRTLYTIINGEIVYCNVPRE